MCAKRNEQQGTAALFHEHTHTNTNTHTHTQTHTHVVHSHTLGHKFIENVMQNVPHRDSLRSLVQRFGSLERKSLVGPPLASFLVGRGRRRHKGRHRRRRRRLRLGFEDEGRVQWRGSGKNGLSRRVVNDPHKREKGDNHHHSHQYHGSRLQTPTNVAQCFPDGEVNFFVLDIFE